MPGTLVWEGMQIYRQRSPRQRIYLGKIVRNQPKNKPESWSVYIRGVCVAIVNNEITARLQLESMFRKQEDSI